MPSSSAPRRTWMTPIALWTSRALRPALLGIAERRRARASDPPSARTCRRGPCRRARSRVRPGARAPRTRWRHSRGPSPPATSRARRGPTLWRLVVPRPSSGPTGRSPRRRAGRPPSRSWQNQWPVPSERQLQRVEGLPRRVTRAHSRDSQCRASAARCRPGSRGRRHDDRPDRGGRWFSLRLCFFTGGLRPAGPPCTLVWGDPTIPAPLAWVTRCARDGFPRHLRRRRVGRRFQGLWNRHARRVERQVAAPRAHAQALVA